MKILILDDQRSARKITRHMLEDLADVEILEASSLTEAQQLVETNDVGLLLLDIRLSGAPNDRGGLDLLQWVRRSGRLTPAVMISAVSELSEVREAMRLGAQDYVFKDELCPEMLIPIVDGIRERFALRGEVARLRQQVDRTLGISAIMGTSPAIDRVRRLVGRVADADSPVLIRGETGSGKEMVARAVHHSGKRASHPFLAVNCSALPGTLIESMIFGHQRGAFTGADRRVRGQLELAGSGTVLLDEIAEMPIELQAKLLRVIEDRQFRPLGSEEEIAFNARVLAATHVDLERRIVAGTFREDLYFRLNVITIEVPSLVQREEDIAHLLQAFTADKPRKLRFTDDAIRWLSKRRWPGNVRELKNAIERLVLLSESDLVDTSTLDELVGQEPVFVDRELERMARAVLALPAGVGSKLHVIEQATLRQALASCDGNKSAAARLLGMHRKSLDRMLERFSELPARED